MRCWPATAMFGGFRNVAMAVQPEKILKELGKLWVDLSKQDANGVLRACAMTLIAVVDEEHDAQQIGETLGGLMHEHPSRLIVLRVRRSAEVHLEGRVFAQCWMPFGRRQQICCEGIEVTASESSLPDVVSVIRGLIAPDLPVVLYCPSESLLWTTGFQLLVPLAGKLILDSSGMRDSTRVLSYLHALPRGLRKSDLAWSRLTPWRGSIAQIFEDASLRRIIYKLSEIRILWRSSDEPASVYYLAGWFMHVLGAGVKLNVARGVGPDFGSIVRVMLIGPDFESTVELKDSNSVEVHVNGEKKQVTVYPEIGECDALRQELGIAGRDRVFEDVLGLAHLMKGGS